MPLPPPGVPSHQKWDFLETGCAATGRQTVPAAPPFAGTDCPQALPLGVINFQASLDCWSLRYVSLFPRSPGKWDYGFCRGSFVRGSSASTRRVVSTSPEQTLYQEPGSRECVWKVISGSTSEKVGRVRQRRERVSERSTNQLLTAVGSWDPTGDTRGAVCQLQKWSSMCRKS